MSGSERLPAHMREDVERWIEEGQPHPDHHGLFFLAVLSNSLTGTVSRADEKNRAALVDWASWLYLDCPRAARGTRDELVAWHELGGLVGMARRIAELDAARAKLDELDDAGTNMDPDPAGVVA